ncbi:hypothetical protein K438DRAFT_1762156 [Mycena galopus ATCC 62051]|nr:hypothetical protein K438DRAFT_1762156 [Mycena galopus ATCC 62051]
MLFSSLLYKYDFFLRVEASFVTLCGGLRPHIVHKRPWTAPASPTALSELKKELDVELAKKIHAPTSKSSISQASEKYTTLLAAATASTRVDLRTLELQSQEPSPRWSVFSPFPCIKPTTLGEPIMYPALDDDLFPVRPRDYPRLTYSDDDEFDQLEPSQPSPPHSAAPRAHSLDYSQVENSSVTGALSGATWTPRKCVSTVNNTLKINYHSEPEDDRRSELLSEDSDDSDQGHASPSPRRGGISSVQNQVTEQVGGGTRSAGPARRAPRGSSAPPVSPYQLRPKLTPTKRAPSSTQDAVLRRAEIPVTPLLEEQYQKRPRTRKPPPALEFPLETAAGPTGQPPSVSGLSHPRLDFSKLSYNHLNYAEHEPPRKDLPGQRNPMRPNSKPPPRTDAGEPPLRVLSVNPFATGKGSALTDFYDANDFRPAPPPSHSVDMAPQTVCPQDIVSTAGPNPGPTSLSAIAEEVEEPEEPTASNHEPEMEASESDGDTEATVRRKGGRPTNAARQKMKECFEQLQEQIANLAEDIDQSEESLLLRFNTYMADSASARGFHAFNVYQRYANNPNFRRNELARIKQHVPKNPPPLDSVQLARAWPLFKAAYPNGDAFALLRAYADVVNAEEASNETLGQRTRSFERQFGILDRIFSKHGFDSWFTMVGRHVNEDGGLGGHHTTSNLNGIFDHLKFEPDDLIGHCKTVAYGTVAKSAIAARSRIEYAPPVPAPIGGRPGDANINALRQLLDWISMQDLGFNVFTNRGGPIVFWADLAAKWAQNNVILLGFPYTIGTKLRLPHQVRQNKGINGLQKIDREALEKAITMRENRDGAQLDWEDYIRYSTADEDEEDRIAKGAKGKGRARSKAPVAGGTKSIVPVASRTKSKSVKGKLPQRNNSDPDSGSPKSQPKPRPMRKRKVAISQPTISSDEDEDEYVPDAPINPRSRRPSMPRSAASQVGGGMRMEVVLPRTEATVPKVRKHREQEESSGREGSHKRRRPDLTGPPITSGSRRSPPHASGSGSHTSSRHTPVATAQPAAPDPASIAAPLAPLAPSGAVDPRQLMTPEGIRDFLAQMQALQAIFGAAANSQDA